MNRPTGPKQILSSLIVAAALLVSPACGGSDDEPPATSAAFTPLSPTPGSGSITMQPGGVSGNVVRIRIAVKDVAAFFGAAFHVTYDPTTAAYDSMVSTDSFLREAGVSTSFQAALVRPGDLAVAATRLQNGAGTVPGVNVAEEDLIELVFRATTPTAGNTFNFGTPREVRSPSGGAVTVTWSGGTLTSR